MPVRLLLNGDRDFPGYRCSFDESGPAEYGLAYRPLACSFSPLGQDGFAVEFLVVAMDHLSFLFLAQEVTAQVEGFPQGTGCQEKLSQTDASCRRLELLGRRGADAGACRFRSYAALVVSISASTSRSLRA